MISLNFFNIKNVYPYGSHYRELKVAYRRRYYLRKKVNTLEKALDKAETEWGKEKG